LLAQEVVAEKSDAADWLIAELSKLPKPIVLAS
jgi:hypothetical protein